MNHFILWDKKEVLLAIILSLGSTISFFFGIYTIMNVFYFSEDIEVILPLPFKSSEIVFGKFIAVLINMYIYTAMLVLPLIVYGVVSKASFMYYLVCNNCTYNNTNTSNDISITYMYGTYEIY